MSLISQKINGFENSISALPNKVENKSAWLKEQFDARTNKEVKNSINGIVNELTATTGASEIGAVVPTGVTANGNIQEVLNGLSKKITEETYLRGSADMTKFIYDKTDSGSVDNAKNAENAKKLNGKLANEYAPIESAIHTYTHSKTGTVHNLSGTGANGKMLVTAQVNTGDTFAVNGVATTAYTGEDTTDSLPVGRWVSFIFDGTALNFKSGGGGATLKILAVATENNLPRAASENTIAVITTTPISGYIVAKDEPTSGLKNGLVWVLTGGASQTPIVLNKKTGLTIYPQGTQQYINGVWVDKTIKVYQNARWRDVGVFLVDYGKDCTAVTGGWAYNKGYAQNGGYAFTANGINMWEPAGQHNHTLSTNKNYDLSNFGEIKFTYTVNTAQPDAMAIFGVKIDAVNLMTEVPIRLMARADKLKKSPSKNTCTLATNSCKYPLHIGLSMAWQINADINQVILF